jgi:hypothetical protein
MSAQTFKLTLGSEYFVNTNLKDQVKQRYLKVVSELKHIYYKWYHKLLNKLTLGCSFKEAWVHTVESIPVKIEWGLGSFGKR